MMLLLGPAQTNQLKRTSSSGQAQTDQCSAVTEHEEHNSWSAVPVRDLLNSRGKGEE